MDIGMEDKSEADPTLPTDDRFAMPEAGQKIRRRGKLGRPPVLHGYAGLFSSRLVYLKVVLGSLLVPYSRACFASLYPDALYRHSFRASFYADALGCVQLHYIWLATHELMKGWDLHTAFQKTAQEILSLTSADGRVISELFVELPLEEEYPDYYEEIENPISIQLILERIDREHYATWDEYLDDWLLLAKNAQKYNEPGSQVFNDALTIQKFVLRRTKHIRKIPELIGAVYRVADGTRAKGPAEDLNEPPVEPPVGPKAVKKARKEASLPDKKSQGEEKASGTSLQEYDNDVREHTPDEGSTPRRKRDKRIHTLATKANNENSPNSTQSGSAEALAEIQIQKGKRRRAALIDSAASPQSREELYVSFENHEPNEAVLEFLKAQDFDKLDDCNLDGNPVRWSLLHCAAYYGRLSAVQCMVETGASLELRDDTFGSSALSWAAFAGRFETCKYLVIECKADRNSTNYLSMTPLDLCPHSEEKKWKFLLTVSASDDPNKLTAHLRSKLRLNGRLLRDLLQKLVDYIPAGATEPLAAPLMELPSLKDEPEYYATIVNPLSFSLILVRPRAYRYLWLLDEHVGLVFSNAQRYYPPEHPKHQAALAVKEVYARLRDELLATSDGDAILQLNEKHEGSALPTFFYEGVLFGIGDYILVKDPELRKELDILLLTEILHEGEGWSASGPGFKCLSGIPEAAKFPFQPNEVFKVGTKFKAPFSAFSSKCCIVSLKVFSKYRVENFPPEAVFLCEFRYAPEGSDAFQTIKDWSKTVCNFPFFGADLKERESPLCFVRPPFSDFDPHIYSLKKRTRRNPIMVTLPLGPPSRSQAGAPAPEATSAPAAIEPELPRPETPRLDRETEPREGEAPALLATIEVEAITQDELTPCTCPKLVFAADEDCFSLTFGAEVSCAIIAPQKVDVGSEWIQIKLISDHQEFPPLSKLVPKFKFPLRPGLNVARIQASVVLPDALVDPASDGSTHARAADPGIAGFQSSSMHRLTAAIKFILVSAYVNHATVIAFPLGDIANSDISKIQPGFLSEARSMLGLLTRPSAHLASCELC
ncbi:hypothetical protein L0F63_005337 [Massospora cicadina]|nr:hypothetical protein L0F63_005337 [Massospora cicadina]